MASFPTLGFMQGGFFGKKLQKAAGGAPDNPHGYVCIKRFFGLDAKPPALPEPGPRGQEKPLPYKVEPSKVASPVEVWDVELRGEMVVRQVGNHASVIVSRIIDTIPEGMSYTALRAKYAVKLHQWSKQNNRDIRTKKFTETPTALIRNADIVYILYSVRQVRRTQEEK
jgi:hypothetical protein